MTAGHIVILSFLSMIFILKSLFVSPISVFFALFISLLELFVAFLQAYIFTMLTSLLSECLFIRSIRLYRKAILVL